MKRGKYWISAPAIAVLGLMHLSSATAESPPFTLTQTFLRPTPGPEDKFGGSVAIFGDKVLIGAIGGQGAGDPGGAYLFDAVTGNLLQTFLKPARAVAADTRMLSHQHS